MHNLLLLAFSASCSFMENKVNCHVFLLVHEAFLVARVFCSQISSQPVIQTCNGMFSKIEETVTSRVFVFLSVRNSVQRSLFVLLFLYASNFKCPLHTNSGCGKREAHINWSIMTCKMAAPVTGTTLRTTGPVPADSRQ